MKKQTQFQRGDIVRVRRSDKTFTETCYVLTDVNGFHCMMGEYRGRTICTPQPFDTSLIERVDRVPSNKIRA